MERFLREVGKVLSWVWVLTEEWWSLREEGETGEGHGKGDA